MGVLASWLENTMDEDHAALAAGLRRGDPDVVDGLIERYQHRLFRYLLAITRHRPAAEDLFQETWLRVLERGGQYRPHWKFESWLFGIARHLAIDLSRRKTAGSLDQLLEPDDGTPIALPSAGRSPLEETLAGEEAGRIFGALEALAPAYREVLVLRFQEELSIEEIARIIDAPLSTTKSRLYRGLEAVRRKLGDTP
jgi:RNA polymerase sigma-70 factor, ECF subfamily